MSNTHITVYNTYVTTCAKIHVYAYLSAYMHVNACAKIRIAFMHRHHKLVYNNEYML